MNQTSIRTMPARSGHVQPERRATRGSRQRNARTLRRRWLILFGVVMIVVIGVLANIGPLTHLQDASGRLDKVNTRVASLEAQRSKLQAELARLNESGYLETLARQKLTYARPGEDVYIITGETTGATTGTDSVLSASSTAGTDTATAEKPGFLERIVTAIRGLF